MNRALRRFQQRKAKVRLYRMLWNLWGPDSFALERPWRAYNQMGAYMMNEPGRWVREMMIRPARARTHHRLRAVENGVDPELITWPDFKKPHIYYW